VAFSQTSHTKTISNLWGGLIHALERDLVIRFYLGLLLVIFLIGAKPISFSEVQDPCEADPLQGWWIVKSSRRWDADVKPKDDSDEVGIFVFFSKGKMTFYKTLQFKKIGEMGIHIIYGQNEGIGGIDLKDGQETLQALFLLQGEKLSLCLQTNQPKIRPNTCGPGKNHLLIEFTRYQPNRLVQSSKIPQSK
jgi:hypothetical protein